MNEEQSQGPEANAAPAPVHRVVMRQIIDVRMDGNWIEFWFADGNRDPFNYDESCKNDTFVELLVFFDLYVHAWKHGLIGLWVEWPKGENSPLSVRTQLSV